MHLIDLYLRANQAAWKRLPPGVRNSRLARRYGALLHRLVCRRAQRRQYFGTFFLRNRPLLEQLRRLLDAWPRGTRVRIAVLGCSIGAEVYSLLWAIRSTRPDLRISVQATDISQEVLDAAAAAAYTNETSGLVGASIFERLTERELQEIFTWHGGQATVKPWIREGVGWYLGDAADPRLIETLGPQDIVLANNFLCHMQPALAEQCLRNIARLPAPGGYLVVLGVDLEVRTKVAEELRWQPQTAMIREIHNGDPSAAGDWPWAWWGVEPLDDRRRDWLSRYAAVYRLS
ncbi:MAG TPA: CheR family methyltransferase [Steroidobacteraceae bacterium]|jgi:chemotaxis methyl-accepting protein methylase